MATSTKKTATKKPTQRRTPKPRVASTSTSTPQPPPDENISELGKKLWAIRKRIEASGVPLLTMEEIEQELAEQRREYLWQDD